MPAYDYAFVLWGADRPLYWGSVPLYWRAVLVDEEPSAGLVSYSAEEYLVALAALMPVGHAWSRDPASAVMQVLRAIAFEMERVDARGGQLYSEADPRTAVEMLVDWERVAGLPDPCVTAAQTVAERRASVIGRLNNIGSQSRAFFIGLAAQLGYAVVIDEFDSPAAALAAGVVFSGDEWAHIWRVNVSTPVAITPFMVGSGSAGEPLRSWGNEAIECQFNRLKPAHTRVLFAYGI